MSQAAAALPQQSAMDGAVRYLVTNYNPKGNRVGWLMMASILVEAWDLYSIAFVLVFIRDQYHPDPLLLGLAAAGTQGGALVGALLGGWLSDKIGRRVMFLATMIMFIILALAQAFVTSVGWLVVVRFLLGVPLGSDISNGYTYIMESMPKGEREVMGNRWQFMFAVGEVLTLAVIAVFLVANLPHEMVWRVTLGPRRRAGADHPADAPRPARDRGLADPPRPVPRGQAGRACRCTATISTCCPTRTSSCRSRARPPSWPTSARTRSAGAPRSIGWIACFAQGSEFSTFAFYLPVLFVMVGVSSMLGINLVTMALYVVAAISGWVGPLLTPKIGQRGISIAGFAHRAGLAAGRRLGALHRPHLVLPFAAAAMLWGHYWDASNCMTIPTVVAKPEYRGTASGFAYMFVKLPSFLAIFLFPSLFAADRPGRARRCSWRSSR